jgi:hypothetical protein
MNHLKTLTGFYPEHIKKEDKVFFIPSMSYFTDKEKDEIQFLRLQGQTSYLI